MSADTTVSELQALLSRVLALYSDDTVARVLVGSVVFPAGAANYGDIVLTTPTDRDFHAQRLELMLDSRQVVPGANPPVSESTYRPFDWASADIGNAIGGAELRKPSVVFEVIESSGRTLQNAALFVSYACSTRWAGPFVVFTSAQRGGVVFQRDRFIARGSTVVVRVSPLFFYPTVAGAATQYEYRVTAYLSGYHRRA